MGKILQPAGTVGIALTTAAAHLLLKRAAEVLEALEPQRARHPHQRVRLDPGGIGQLAHGGDGDCSGIFQQEGRSPAQLWGHVALGGGEPLEHGLGRTRIGRSRALGGCVRRFGVVDRAG